MILGVLSDTHGQAQRAERAMTLLKEHGASAFIHCGDLCGDGVLAALAGEKAWFVWGNCDLPSAGLSDFAASLGLPVPQGVPLRIELAGRKIAVFHGHEREFASVYALLNGEDGSPPPMLDGVDYVFYGHTHIKSDRRVKRMRLINPGALHRARPYTVATLDLLTDALQFHPVI